MIDNMSTPTVTREQLISLVQDLPEEQLAVVYEYLLHLEGGAARVAAADDAETQAIRPEVQQAIDATLREGAEVWAELAKH